LVGLRAIFFQNEPLNFKKSLPHAKNTIRVSALSPTADWLAFNRSVRARSGLYLVHGADFAAFATLAHHAFATRIFCLTPPQFKFF
jgi:hypothetical protein